MMRRTAKTNSNTHTAKEGAKGSFSRMASAISLNSTAALLRPIKPHRMPMNDVEVKPCVIVIAPSTHKTMAPPMLAGPDSASRLYSDTAMLLCC